MKKLDKINKELFTGMEVNKINNLSSIVGGNWVKYTGNGTTTGDKEVRTGNQDGGGDATDPKEGQDNYETTPSCDMGGIFTTSDRDTVTPNTADVASVSINDTPSAF
jgi:hypothetical protein